MRERAGNVSGSDALRITAQFRARGGMAYELRERGARLTLLITEAPEALERRTTHDGGEDPDLVGIVPGQLPVTDRETEHE